MHVAAVLVTLFVTGALATQPWTAPSTEKIFEAIGVREGATVCEIGAGDGALTIAAARAVGTTGRVLTSELGETRVQRLRTAVESGGLPNITVVAGDTAKTNFPDGACDALFLRDVYHHFTEPAAMNVAIRAALKPGARAAVVDFTPPGEEATPAGRAKDGSHGVYPETVAREMRDSGLELISTDRGTRWFVVVVERPRQSVRLRSSQIANLQMNVDGSRLCN